MDLWFEVAALVLLFLLLITVPISIRSIAKHPPNEPIYSKSNVEEQLAEIMGQYVYVEHVTGMYGNALARIGQRLDRIDSRLATKEG